jgi:hypothetical protein
MSGKSHKFASSFEHRVAIVGSATDGDAAAPPEFHESFVSEGSQRSQYGVVVHAQHCGQVASSWKTFARFCVSLSDRTANLCGNLLMEGSLI